MSAPAENRIADAAPHESNGRGVLPIEAADDPHRLARIFLRERYTDADDRRTIRFWQGEFHGWSRGAYRPLPDSDLKSMLADQIKHEFDRVAHRQRMHTGKPATVGRVTRTLVGNVILAMGGESLLPADVAQPSWLDAAPWPAAEMLACRNGLVHLPSFMAGLPYAAEATPAYFSPNALDFDFDAGAGAPERWLRFLAELWPDDGQSIEALQEWLGYLLLPDTRQQKIFLLVGPKRSGKGTIARVIRALVGEGNCTAPTLAGLGTQFGLWPLLGKTLAIVSDARLSGRSDVGAVVENLLAVSGEDARTVDRKCLPPVTTKLAARFMVLTNELPNLADSAGALAGRMIVLRLTRSWFGHEDTELSDTLLAERPGILLWAIAGLRRLRERGRFAQPESGCELLADLERLGSPITAFIEERCMVAPGAQVATDDLFAAWREWCGRCGREHTGTIQTFGRDLRAALPNVRVVQPRDSGGRIRMYEGLTLSGTHWHA